MFAAALPAAHGEAYPGKPVRMVIGFSAGGTTDLVGRAVAQQLGDIWGQPVVVENKPGASGMTAAELVAKSAPDGYTLLVTPQTSVAVAPALYGKAPYDTPHMAGELLGAQLGIKQNHVPYKGENPALIDTIGGQVPIMYGNISAVLQQIKAGRLRALANTGAQRSPLLPEVPTVAESGLKGFAIATWFGLFGPAGMPAEQVTKIQQDVARALAIPEVRARLTELGVDIVASTPQDFGAYVRSEMVRYEKIIKEGGIKPE